MQQSCARHVRVGDPVVAEDPDGYPQRMASVGLALPPVLLVQPRHQHQGGFDTGTLLAGKKWAGRTGPNAGMKGR